ncbi:unnamed protein product [Microthlaspi erraticum]|uniref:Uncharacterized protein n=1 Tax=Microthlaspi erraticum TaxID=1685480 RepID=A0A6D2I835_9BRAS|nr:unnamed protein product [Microthlaspi erraticum]
MPEEVLCFLWYLCSVYTIGITFDIGWLYQHINAKQGQKDCLSTFLTWFTSLSNWSGNLRRSAKATNLPFKKLKDKDFQAHAFRLNNARQTFSIPFNHSWSYYPFNYQISLDEDLQYFMESKQTVKATQKTKKRNVPETVKQEPTSQHAPQEYFQDAQLPDDEINIDEIGRRFNIDVNIKSEENF